MQSSGEHLALNKNVEALDSNLERSNLRILIPDEHPAMIKTPTWVENKIESVWESNFIPFVDIYEISGPCFKSLDMDSLHVSDVFKVYFWQRQSL